MTSNFLVSVLFYFFFFHNEYFCSDLKTPIYLELTIYKVFRCSYQKNNWECITLFTSESFLRNEERGNRKRPSNVKKSMPVCSQKRVWEAVKAVANSSWTSREWLSLATLKNNLCTSSNQSVLGPALCQPNCQWWKNFDSNVGIFF